MAVCDWSGSCRWRKHVDLRLQLAWHQDPGQVYEIYAVRMGVECPMLAVYVFRPIRLSYISVVVKIGRQLKSGCPDHRKSPPGLILAPVFSLLCRCCAYKWVWAM